MQKKYTELTNKEKQDLINKGILNGFGPEIKKEYSLFRKIFLFIFRYILKKISKHFNLADSYYHDYGYYIGGTEEDRFNCDTKFHYYICRDINNLHKNVIKKAFLYVLASIFYLAVRIGGKPCFNYYKK